MIEDKKCTPLSKSVFFLISLSPQAFSVSHLLSLSPSFCRRLFCTGRNCLVVKHQHVRQLWGRFAAVCVCVCRGRPLAGSSRQRVMWSDPLSPETERERSDVCLSFSLSLAFFLSSSCCLFSFPDHHSSLEKKNTNRRKLI